VDSDHADVRAELDRGTRVGLVEIRRPPNNYLTVFTVRAVAAALEKLDADPDCGCVVVASAGKHFSAGRDFGTARDPQDTSAAVYREAGRLLRLRTPWVAAVQGGAIGAGLGLVLAADFRVCAPRAYFSASFVQAGLHHGFGLTVTLPAVVGWQAATDMLYTGRRVGATEALALRLADRVVDEPGLRAEASAFAAAIAANSPVALQAIRATMRAGLAERFAAATEHESAAQQAGTRWTADDSR
jgi:enoyl-CoA hydratase/carnithine racemase